MDYSMVCDTSDDAYLVCRGVWTYGHTVESYDDGTVRLLSGAGGAVTVRATYVQWLVTAATAAVKAGNDSFVPQ